MVHGSNYLEGSSVPHFVTILARLLRASTPVFVFWAVSFFEIFAFCAGARAQSVTPDGSTQTQVATTASGAIQVDIAKPNPSGISVNRYSSFNVPQTGVSLTNTIAKAATILNEVTSTKRSLLEGPLSVVGPAADVILANPNGVTINGGSFVDTGRVAVITGRNIATAAGDPLQFKINGGSIVVGTRGLSAAISQLDLIANRIRINGAIADTRATRELRLNLTTGVSTAEIDPKIPKTTQTSWVTEKPDSGGVDTVRLVVSSGAAINGGTVSLTANGKGSGINLEGSGLASSGNFIVTADGKIAIRKAKVEAQQNLAINGETVSIDGSEAATSLRSTNSGVLISSKGDVLLKGAFNLRGKTKSTFGFSALGAVSINAKGNIFADSGLKSGNLTSDEDGISVEASGDFVDNGTNYASAKDIIFGAGRVLTLQLSKLRAADNISVIAGSNADITGANLKTETSALFKSAAISFESTGSVRNQVVAESGGILIESDGDVTNIGSLIQGKKRINGSQASAGGVTIISSGSLTNKTIREDQIGSFFSTDDDLVISVADKVQNQSGRLLSNKDINIVAENSFANVVAKAGVETSGNTSKIKKYSGPKRLLLRNTTQRINYGTHLAGSEIGTVAAVEKVSITAKSILNSGGDITGKNVRLNGVTITNRAERFGSHTIRKRCFFIFCRFSGSARVTRDGGAVTASKNIFIKASRGFANFGGSLSGRSLINIDAPRVAFGALLLPDYYQRPGGIGSAFSGAWGRVFYRYDGGTVLVSNGSLVLNSDSRVVFDGTTLLIADEIKSSKGHRILGSPAGLGKLNQFFLGYLSDILP